MYKKIISNGSAQEACRAEIKEKLRAHDRVCPRCHTDEWTDFVQEVDNRVWEPKVMAEFGHIYKIYICRKCGAQWAIYPDEIDEAVSALYKLEEERGEELLDYDYDMEI